MSDWKQCDAPLLNAIKGLLLDMARQRTVDSLLRLMVTRLNELPDVALARVWLIDRGDQCATCGFRDECPDQRNCLHLVASAGASRQGETWESVNGRFRRIPLGVRKVGRIASSRTAVVVPDIAVDATWIADPQWAEDEGIRGFVGQPLISRDKTLGVLGIFLRVPAEAEALPWLRMVADHAASAIDTARAFEEIDRLRTQLALENEYLRDEVKVATGCCAGILGDSPPLQKVLRQVELVGPTEATVLVLGESGVGKELIARAIHEVSSRESGPLIKVNCASIPRELFESEFFGHVQGSFTGAVRDRAGRFELADGGTLFLDEVGEIPLDMQGKLLRVLQEGTYERIGEEQTRAADVRIVAATNRDLEAEVAGKRFRQDLYYRLSVFPIDVPPLRQRKDDIPLLASSFLEAQGRKLGLSPPPLKRRHVVELQAYDWPGNVRELQNVVERAVIRSRNGPLRFELPMTVPSEPRSPAAASRTSSANASSFSAADGGDRLLTEIEMRDRERDNLLAVMDHHRWKISGPGGAAEFLGLHPATLTSRLKSMKLRKPG